MLTRILAPMFCVAVLTSCRPQFKENNPQSVQLSSTRAIKTEHDITYAVCKLSTSKLQPNRIYTLEAISMGKRQVYNTYRVNEKGELVQRDDHAKKLKDNRIYLVNSSLKGIPVRFNLVSKDGKEVISTKVIPFPLEAEGRGGAKISLEAQDTNGITFLIYMQGFKPYEQVMFKTKTATQNSSKVITTNERGEFMGVLSHTHENPKLGKDSKVEVMRTNETLKIDYTWGNKFPLVFPFFRNIKQN